MELSFNVRVLTRETSTSTFPSGVHVIKTDYSPSSLRLALQGQDAVICSFGFEALDMQIALIDAAEEVGVKRFVPSEFGTQRTENDLPEFEALMQKKQQVEDYMRGKAEKNRNFTWSAFATGPFLDWVCFLKNQCRPRYHSIVAVATVELFFWSTNARRQGLAVFPFFGFALRKKTATIYDSGNEPFTATTLANIGKAVAAALKRPEETKNRWVQINSIKTTQNELLATLEGETGKTWEKTTVSTEDVLADAKEKMKNGDFGGGFVGILVTQLFQEGAGRAITDGKDNGLLGVPQERLDAVVQRVLTEV